MIHIEARFLEVTQRLTPIPRGAPRVRPLAVCVMGVGNGRTVDFSHWVCYYLVQPLVRSSGWYLTRLYVQSGSTPGAWRHGACSSHEIRSLKTHPKPTFFLLARVLPGCVWGAQRGILEQKLMTGTPFLVTCYTPTRALVEVNPVCTRIPMNPTRSFGQQ